MRYIEYAEYSAIRGLENISRDDFDEYLPLAMDIVNGLTFSAIESMNLMEDDHYRPRIVRATAMIIDSIHRNGGSSAVLSLDGRNASSKSETIGSYSYSVSYKGGSQDSTAYGIPIPPIARILLMPIQALGRTR